MVATAGVDAMVRVWDVLAGGQLCAFAGHDARVSVVAFCAKGKLLVSGSDDTTALVWDVSRLFPSKAEHTVSLSPEQLSALWADLKNEDASKAYDVLCALVAAPANSLPFLREHLRAIPRVDPQRVAQLLSDLDSARFSAHDKATQELERLAELAEPALRQALAANPSTEARQRLEQLLKKRENEILTLEQLQTLRAIEILEHIGRPEAKQVLQTLAKGVPEARLTQEATASLERLSKRR